MSLLEEEVRAAKTTEEGQEKEKGKKNSEEDGGKGTVEAEKDKERRRMLRNGQRSGLSMKEPKKIVT